MSLLGAQINGNLECKSASFSGGHKEDLSLDSLVVEGGLFLLNLSNSARIKASHAKVSVLVDDIDCWGSGSSLDGLSYETLGGDAPVKACERIDWLDKQVEKHKNELGFCPQPWRQIQRVLHEMGHTESAKIIGIEYQKRLRKVNRIGYSENGMKCMADICRYITTYSIHGIFGFLAGYGYRPMRLVAYMLLIWLSGALIYGKLALYPYNAIAPSDPLIFQNEIYSQCRPSHLKVGEDAEKLGNWTSCTLMPGEYPTFNEYAYSLDLILPVVDLGLEDAWGAYIPSVNEGQKNIPYIDLPWGYAVQLMAWFQIIFGWISTLLLVAIVSSYARRSDEN